MNYFKNLLSQNQLEGVFLDILLIFSQFFVLFLLADGLLGPFLHGQQKDRQNQAYLSAQLRSANKFDEIPKADLKEIPVVKDQSSVANPPKNMVSNAIDNPDRFTLGRPKTSDEIPFLEQSTKGFRGQAPIPKNNPQNAHLEQQQQNQAIQQHQQMLGIMQAQSQLQNLLGTLAEDQVFICTNQGGKTFHCKPGKGQSSYLEDILSSLLTQELCSTIHISKTQGLVKNGCQP